MVDISIGISQAALKLGHPDDLGTWITIWVILKFNLGVIKIVRLTF